jgi:hypothetical protein
MQTYLVDIDDTVYSRTEQLDDALQNLMNIKPFSGVKNFCTEHDCVFVTTGDPLLQMKKMRILGLKKSASAIHVVSENKQKFSVFKLYPSSIVLGNRRDAEIRYGNLAGHYTVLFLHGKYANLPIETEHDCANEEYDCISEYVHKI